MLYKLLRPNSYFYVTPKAAFTFAASRLAFSAADRTLKHAQSYLLFKNAWSFRLLAYHQISRAEKASGKSDKVSKTYVSADASASCISYVTTQIIISRKSNISRNEKPLRAEEPQFSSETDN